MDLNATSLGQEFENEKSILTRYPKTNFLVISLIGVGFFALYMKWEEAQKKKKHEGVIEIHKTGWTKEKDPEEWKMSGNRAFKNKHFEEAISDYTVAISLAKEKPSAIYYVNRANAFYEMKKFDEAIQDCKSAFDIDPENPK